MKPLTWLASYPKSGNTWLRIFLANLESNSEQPLSINSIKSSPISSSGTMLEEVLGYEVDLLTRDENERLLPKVFRHLAQSEAFNQPLKAHHAFIKNSQGEWLLPPDVTDRAVYLLRNPLDVAVSFARHEGHDTFDSTINWMCDDDTTLAPKKRGFSIQIPHRICSWSRHVQSWIDAPINVLIVRYEDLLAEPHNHFTKIVTHLGLCHSPEQIERAIKNSQFSELESQEKRYGFRENPIKAKRFFNSGKSGIWKHHLSSLQVQNISQTHRTLMRRFAYLDENDKPL